MVCTNIKMHLVAAVGTHVALPHESSGDEGVTAVSHTSSPNASNYPVLNSCTRVVVIKPPQPLTKLEQFVPADAGTQAVTLQELHSPVHVIAPVQAVVST